MAGVAAALWLLGLFAAAPLLRVRSAPPHPLPGASHAQPDASHALPGASHALPGASYTLPDRLRDASILGIAIPLALGAAHLLYSAALWAALAICVTLSLSKRRERQTPSPPLDKLGVTRGTLDASRVPYVTLAAIAVVAWPALMRPPLDGDTLSYHLPNAAAWVHAHGLWSVDARYWWYPPASELFAAALYAVAGPFTVAWSGLAAMLLLGTRLAAWAREEFGATPLLADALAAATVTAAPLAMQAGTLQNDVWLAGFFLETLWAARSRDGAATLAAAVTALIKPYGWIFAFVAAACTRAPLRVWLAAAVAILAWVGHDALLWQHAIVPPAQTSTANGWASTILAHGWQGVALFARVMGASAPFALLAYLAAFAGPAIAGARHRNLGWAGFAAAAWFLVMPLAFADWHPQLATGGSLRFTAPAVALGALLLARIAARIALPATLLALASAAYGAATALAVFWNDVPTRLALAVAALTVVVIFAGRRWRSPWPAAAGFACAVVAATWLEARIPASYYADALAVDGARSGVYAWFASERPAAIGGWGLRLGAVDVLSPQTRTLDLPDDAPCATARAQGVFLAAVAEPDRGSAFNRARLAAARACGRVLFDDGLAVVASPAAR